MPQQVPHDCPLTEQQYYVIKSLASGGEVSEVAHVLGRSASVVRSHKQAGLKRLLARNLDEARRILRETGWWDFEPPEKPLREDQPFLAAYVQAFTRSGWPATELDARTESALRVALTGHRLTHRSVKEEVTHAADRPRT